MAKQRAIRNRFSYWGLIAFGCALLFFTPVNRAEHSLLPCPAVQPAASPTVTIADSCQQASGERGDASANLYLDGYNLQKLLFVRREYPP